MDFLLHDHLFFESLITHKRFIFEESYVSYGKRQKSCTLIVVLVKRLYLTSLIFNSSAKSNRLFFIANEEVHICSEFPENFYANCGQTFFIAPLDHSVKLWNNLFGLFKPLSPMYFLTGFHRSWVRRPTTGLKILLLNGTKLFNGPYFWMILLP